MSTASTTTNTLAPVAKNRNKKLGWLLFALMMILLVGSVIYIIIFPSLK